MLRLRGGVLEDVLGLETSSRTHFEVLGLGLEGQILGLEVSSPRKLPCSQLQDSTIFCTVEILLENARNLAETSEDLFCFPQSEIAGKF